MKLNLSSIIGEKNKWEEKGYSLPQYDIQKMREETKQEPIWLHFGAGNIFRAFLCAVNQKLLNERKMTKGIICAESFGTEIITECFHANDNLSVSVTLNGDGSMSKEVLGSVAEALTTKYDMQRIAEIFCQPSLQMVSFTITEKGYALRDADGRLFPIIQQDMESGPEQAKHLMSIIAALCIKRFHACGKPLALVSMDNCSHNGEKIQSAVLEIAGEWKKNGQITAEELDYLERMISYPWSMIDKITPRPDARVEEILASDGIENIRPFVTETGVYIAPFVNAERAQYLVIEDQFPNGRLPLQEAGIIFTDRETVNKVEKMKVCTCLNPLHTALAIFGCLLGYTSIAEETKDEQLMELIRQMSAKEGMPVVVNPGIIDPQKFLNEVLQERFPNPFMPDTPQRIATDTSQKLSIRYGETIKAHIQRGTADELMLIPLVIAGWLRYLLAVDDDGKTFELSSDPLLEDCQDKLKNICFGDTQVDSSELKPLLSNEVIFGVNLFEIGMAEKITAYFNELKAGPGAVRSVLKKYTAR